MHDDAHIGVEFQLPLRQFFDVGSVRPFNYLLHQLSPYQHHQLGVSDLVQIADQSVFFLAAVDLSHGECIEGSRLLGLTRMIMREPLDDLRRGEIHDTVVLKDRRREHIGEKLTRKAIEQARCLGYRWIELACRPARVEAIRMYQKLGFQLVTPADPNVEGSRHLFRLWLEPLEPLKVKSAHQSTVLAGIPAQTQSRPQ